MFLASTNAVSGWAGAVERFLATPSEESFQELFRALVPRMITYFRARGCRVELAEDLTQEVMLAVHRHTGRLRSKELFRPWLYRIAQNALRRHLRDVGRRVTTVECDFDVEETHSREGDPLLHSQFAEWMAWLNPEERRIMMLRYVDDLEHHEIAAVLGIPLGTVQWRIFQAKRKLAARFGAGAT